MSLQDVSLADRYDLGRQRVLLSGTQALVRALLMQKARDVRAGLATAGYATGYRGSPLGGLDMQMQRAAAALAAADVRAAPALNEDLAATALWGTQQAQLRGEGRVGGVFGLWYGKGPGVDRSGDAFRHANMAGTAALGGVVAALGDDHTGESSTTLHQSEFAMVDAMMPVLSPAGVQEVLDHALLGWALSRHAGCWVGLKCVKDVIEVSEVVDGDPHRLALRVPLDPLPEGGLNIRLGDTPAAQEARLHHHKLPAAAAFARANRIDRRVWGGPGCRIGIVSSGKAWRDTEHALRLLGLDAGSAAAAGVTTYKVGMVWPLEPQGLAAWAEGLDLVIVVEEKRKLLEPQIRDTLYHRPDRPRVLGGTDAAGAPMFPSTGALDPVGIGRALGTILAGAGVGGESLRARLERLEAALAAEAGASAVERLPWFCPGCPHNTSTRVPDGSRAYAGIGCHYMAQWMERGTEGFTHMGGEGANWIGEAPFSTRTHVFQNLGDGTYNHSGLQAVRAAVAAGTTMTYKILFNDAVAMTGGQANDGGLTPQRIAAELVAMGVAPLVGVYDPAEPLDGAGFPPGMRLCPRDELDTVQRELAAAPGVSAILYIQTCAAEKRRRRRRGSFPEAGRRVFINPDVCEGCGDCGVQSNCVAIVPLDTPFGRKRAIDQSACNGDLSCLKGFCPSFVTVEGGRPRPGEVVSLPDVALPEPTLPPLGDGHALVITGIGGTGVVTLGAVLAMAAHLEGRGAAVMEMAGLAQKGGAVHIHCRFAPDPAAIGAVRIAAGEADAVIGGDLVVTAGARTLALAEPGRTRVVLNTHGTMTGAFTLDRRAALPGDALVAAVSARVGASRLAALDASALAARWLGDSIHANVLLLGAAWQAGLVPLSEAAILRAIEINGVDVEGNRRAFRLGRRAVARPGDLDTAPGGDAATNDPVDRLAGHLARYQDEALAARYRARVAAAAACDPDLGRAVAEGYHRLLAYKDEYEVARLHAEGTRAAIAAGFTDVRAIRLHLAPPLLARIGPDGRPCKRAFGPWILPVLGLLARFRRLRGTRLDPFGYTRERRMERALIAQYEADMDWVQATWAPERRGAALELARLPLEIRGFGPVKAAAMAQAAARRGELLAALEDAPAALAAE